MAKKYVRKTNLESLKRELENQKTGGGNGGFKFWKPIKYGKYTVRFLPQQQSDSFFYKEAAQHKVGDNYYFCPKVEGDDCPICETYRKLWDIGSDAAIAIARQIKPRKQYLYNIIVKDELGEKRDTPTKVETYMSGKKLFDKLMDYFFDPDYGDLTDVEEGFDFVISKEEGSQGFPSYDNSRPRPKATSLHDDEDIIEVILASVKDLNKEVEYKSYEELKKTLDHYMNNEKDFEMAGSSKPSKKEEAKVKEEEAEDEEEDEDDISDFKAQLLKDLED